MSTKARWPRRLANLSEHTAKHRHHPAGVGCFVLAGSGSGKTTVRRAVVETFAPTYICNAKMREVLTKYSEAVAAGMQLKAVADTMLVRLPDPLDEARCQRKNTGLKCTPDFCLTTRAA